MGQGLGLSDAVGGFLDNYMSQKRRKEDERRNLIIEALSQQRFDESEAQNLFRRKQVEDTNVFREKKFGAEETQRQFQRDQALIPDDPADFRSVNIKGQGYTFDPNTGKYELEVEDKTKKRAGPKLSSEEWKLFNEIYKNVNNPDLTLQFGKDPFQVFDFARRRLGVTSGPKVAPRRSSVREEEQNRAVSVTPNQGFQQGQEAGQIDPLAQAIEELKAEGIPEEQIQQALRNMGLIQ